MKDQDIVGTGYDRIVDAYLQDRGPEEKSGWLARFIADLPQGGHVLDLGCGAGVPVAKTLVQSGFQVTGVDLSPGQIQRARQLVPEAEFQVGDMTQVDFPDRAFDGICALYSIIHVPRETHPALYRSIAGWLKPGGLALLCLGAEEWEGKEPYLEGVEMFWSHYGLDRNRALLQEAGLKEIDSGIVPDPPGSHWFVLATHHPETTF